MMKKRTGILVGITALFCVCALLAAPVAAAVQNAGQNGGPNGDRLTGMLDKLITEGYDVAAIQAAVAAGDLETAHTLMQEFIAANPDAVPARGDRQGAPTGEMITRLLDKLASDGYDVSAIQAAVAAGDLETAHTLMQEFIAANPDAVPARGDRPGAPSGEMITGLLDKLTTEGYDVSAIQAAVAAGDLETAHTLMQEFIAANPDAMPARGDGPGHAGCRSVEETTE
ncbi:ABC-type uncharacterized transport system substrate-binding protein [Methanolinea mesophila]|uniref:hypothetical protein n=1 Tax=Methanolinea mesophila TaxID=547055 RepID=UPI001AE291D1|nr:hypothetical protein [Methanolinea mesophila]MBP1928873.1 ABC-type uncharacterized transport system substrate-binding protein [Methanolinea mesophila]